MFTVVFEHYYSAGFYRQYENWCKILGISVKLTPLNYLYSPSSTQILLERRMLWQHAFEPCLGDSWDYLKVVTICGKLSIIKVKSRIFKFLEVLYRQTCIKGWVQAYFTSDICASKTESNNIFNFYSILLHMLWHHTSYIWIRIWKSTMNHYVQ